MPDDVVGWPISKTAMAEILVTLYEQWPGCEPDCVNDISFTVILQQFAIRYENVVSLAVDVFCCIDLHRLLGEPLPSAHR